MLKGWDFADEAANPIETPIPTPPKKFFKKLLLRLDRNPPNPSGWPV
jgi:hypothetical protein